MRYTIQEWVHANGFEGAFTETYDQLGVKGQAACDTRLLYLRDEPPTMWRDPHAKRLSTEHDDDCKDIYEIRFKANSVQQRPIGYFGPSEGVFTIVLWVTHKGNQYKPKDYCRIAKDRWYDVKSGRAKTRPVEID